MAHNFQTWLNAPVIELQSIDSTNNYAMRLIDADKAQAGMTIIANEQSEGKGQRGHHWLSKPEENLLMSILIVPPFPIEKQFLLSASVAVGLCHVLNEITPNNFLIKWPNDLIINDRKAGGILIENTIRGSQWTFSVVGIGLNILQTVFPNSLPFATSLKKELNKDYAVKEIALNIRQAIIQNLALPESQIFQQYRSLLFKKDECQTFSLNDETFIATLKDVQENGHLLLEMKDGTTKAFNHGAIEWVWG